MNAELARRWRLVLGRYADQQLPTASGDAELETTLAYLYDREYEARGHRRAAGGGGSLDPSALTALNWLANVDPETGRMLVEQVRFTGRQRRRNLDWQVIILVDQSGSMAGSVLHSAVSAAILAGLPGISVRLVLFDTGLADLSHLAGDPVEVLLTSQLGGGTDIAQAMGYAEKLVAQPTRTIVALISDFDEGGSVSALLASVRRLAGSGVRLLGLASLADEGDPWYNRQIAARLAAAGMEIAAMTPDRFAEWLAEVTQ